MNVKFQNAHHIHTPNYPKDASPNTCPESMCTMRGHVPKSIICGWICDSMSFIPRGLGLRHEGVQQSTHPVLTSQPWVRVNKYTFVKMPISYIIYRVRGCSFVTPESSVFVHLHQFIQSSFILLLVHSYPVHRSFFIIQSPCSSLVF